MGLEPTEEQVDELLAAYRASEPGMLPAGRAAVREVIRGTWPLIRDMVLEEAAQSFDAGEVNDHDHDIGWWFQERIRSLKGTP